MSTINTVLLAVLATNILVPSAAVTSNRWQLPWSAAVLDTINNYSADG